MSLLKWMLYGTMEDSRRKLTSVRQLELLITFMEGHSNFAIGQLRSKEGRALAARLWAQCADILNSEGVTRTPKDWSKFWNDYKCRVRAKQAEINRGYRATGSGPNIALQFTSLEERVAALLGRDAGPHMGVRQDPKLQLRDLSIMQGCTDSAPRNRSTATPDLSRTVTLDTPPILTEHNQRVAVNVEGINQPAGQGTTLPQTGNGKNRQKRRRRSHVRPHFRHQSNTAVLDETRMVIARIDESRTRTEEMVATTHLNLSQAALNISEAITNVSQAALTISEAMTSIATSLHTYINRIN